MTHEFLNGRVAIQVADITALRVDAIVNAANKLLLGGGGVDGAIHAAGGPAILAACKEIRRSRYPGGLPTGEAVITPGGNLRARYVIHTVGPIWGQDAEPERLLASCYRESIALATAHKLGSIAFPSISTGAFGYPKPEAAAVASQTLAAALAEMRAPERVLLVFFQRSDADLFVQHQKFSSR